MFHDDMEDHSSKPPKVTPYAAPPSDAYAEVDRSSLYIAEFCGAKVWPLSKPRIVLGDAATAAIKELPAPDISIPDLSGEHCQIAVKGDNTVRLTDLDSGNGTYIGPHLIKGSWDIRAGDRFRPWPAELFLLNTRMLAERDLLFDILGQRGSMTADMVLTEVVRTPKPILIMGPKGSEAELLAEAIHRASHRHAHELTSLASLPGTYQEATDFIRTASRLKATVVYRVQPPPVDVPFLDRLYDDSYGIRPIALASTLEEAYSGLTRDAVQKSYLITIRPIAHREDFAQILDRLFRSLDAPHLRVSDLSPENFEAISSFSWEENLTQLRLFADVAVLLDKHGNLAEVERQTGQDYYPFMRKIGVRLIIKDHRKGSARLTTIFK